MQNLHIQTPLIESRAMSLLAGRPIWLKMDALQPSGSFKLRGIGHACVEHARRGAQRFISSSGGNAGIAVAYAGRRLGVPVTVVVPQSASLRARELILQEGAALEVVRASWQEANAHALGLVGPADAFIHPFDDPLLWRGNSTLIDEVAEAGLKPAALVLAVGGGGLLCGVMEGLQRHSWLDIPVIAVETLGADSFAQAVRAGRPVELPAITSLATSLGARRVSDRALEWYRQGNIRSAVVQDGAAVRACLRFMADQRVVVEPACGAALAVVYEKLPELQGDGPVLVIVCGGVTAPVEQLFKWAEL